MIERLTLREWQAFDAAHPAPTFFARPAWALALSDDNPAFEPCAFAVVENGERYVVPTVRAAARFGLRDYCSFPMGGYTTVLDSTGAPAPATVAASVITRLAARVDRFRVVPWPLASIEHVSGAALAQFETAVIDCRRGLDAALSGMRGVTRRMAGQAQRRGVVCERADAAQCEEYYEILEAASRGWGRSAPSISRTLLRAVLERGGDDAQLWLARADGRTIGGGVIFYGADELFFWSAAMRREYSNLRPSNALNVTLIGQACARGVAWYNLGASEGLEGVARFKRDLGATGIPYSEWTFTSSRFTLYQRARARLTATATRSA